MMFKVGDKVECINIKSGGGKITLGKIYTVTRADSWIWVINDIGKEENFYECRFKKVEDKIMTKKDMVVGKHVYKDRDGEYSAWEECDITNYTNDLTWISKGEKSDYDIMKVYEINPTPVWKREEVKEMTVADIEKLVGCKVKIVKE